MKTPRYVTRTLAAGAYAPIGASGKYLMIASISASTIELAVDDETPQQILQGLAMIMPTGYTRIVLRNAGAVASTVVLYIAENPLDLLTSAVLSAIQQLLTPATAKTGSQSGAIAQTGVGTTAILAANTARKGGFVQASIDNAGRVWLGTTNLVTAATSWFELLPGATSPDLRDTVAVWACSENGTETVRYHETT